MWEADSWLRIRRCEFKPLKMHATGGWMLGVSYREHTKITNMYGNLSVSSPECWVRGVRHRKLSWLNHVCRHYSMPITMLQATAEGGCRKETPGKSWNDNFKEWTSQSLSSLLHVADDRGRRATITAEASVCWSTSTTPRHKGNQLL